jgi:hypothetical protein
MHAFKYCDFYEGINIDDLHMIAGGDDALL